MNDPTLLERTPETTAERYDRQILEALLRIEALLTPAPEAKPAAAPMPAPVKPAAAVKAKPARKRARKK